MNRKEEIKGGQKWEEEAGKRRETFDGRKIFGQA
jgi:hypothetical protein